MRQLCIIKKLTNLMLRSSTPYRQMGRLMYEHFNLDTETPAHPRPRKVVHGAGFVRLHPVSRAGKVAVIVFAVLTLVYFAYRIPLWNSSAPVMSSLLLAAEIFGTLTLALHVLSTWCLVERQAPPAPARCSADIFLTTWNESEAILRHTILAAKQVAHCRYIWLLDDGNRQSMSELAAGLEIKYISRTDRSHAKAGNLNNALRYTDADFVAIFDCDHAPAPDFFARTLGYFNDTSVGLVQTPQDFYNIDSFQHRLSARETEAWHEQTLFYRVIQAGKDYWNSTFFCGSCAIVRRSALADIGGFATGTITEDMHTSLRLHKAGWTAVYHAEALAFGMSPADIEQYETQRLRWGRGAMQVWKQEGIFTADGLSIAQRLAYFTSAITYFEGWQKAIVYLMPIAVLLTGNMPIIWTGAPFLLIFSLWLLSGVLVNEIFSRGYSKSLYMEEYNFLRFYTFMRATLALVIPGNWKFKVTPKQLTSKSRLPIILWPQMFVASAAIIAVPLGAIRFQQTAYLPTGAFVANLIWTTLVAVIAIRALRFASGHGRQRRMDHRFHVPVIVRLDREDSRAHLEVIADEISSSGFSFTFEAGSSLGTTISGHLELPGGRQPFQAVLIQDRPGPLGLRIGAAQFCWPDKSAGDALNSFLYGSTLQWDVNGWAEALQTPYLVRLVRRIAGKAHTRGHWRHGTLGAGTRGKVRCIVREESQTFRILSLEPFPSTVSLDLTLRAPDETHRNLTLAGYRSYSSGGGMLHMAVLYVGTSPNLPGYHREPSWMREVAL